MERSAVSECDRCSGSAVLGPHRVSNQPLTISVVYSPSYILTLLYQRFVHPGVPMNNVKMIQNEKPCPPHLVKQQVEQNAQQQQ